MSRVGRQTIWWWAGGAGTGIVFLAVALKWTLDGTQVAQTGTANEERTSREPAVVVTRIDKHTDAGEQAILFDPKPLFLPTEWNTYERPVPTEVMHQPGEVFRAFEPVLSYGQTEVSLPVAVLPPAPKSALDLLKQPLRQPLIGFGRQDITVVQRQARKGTLEVREMGTGEVVLPAQSLAGNVNPPTDHKDWQPVEFLCAINSAGLVGRPVVIASSQLQEIDAYFREYLVKSFRLGERLAPGFYVVTVGP